MYPTRYSHRTWLAAWAIAFILALAGCAAPPPAPRPPVEQAMPVQGTGQFVTLEEAIRAANGPDASGFRLLESNLDGLKWRLVLIDSASHSLDLQYYVWFGDATGQLLMARLIAAADRGVKVREVWVQHLEESVTGGQVSISFFPMGWAEKAIITLGDGRTTYAIYLYGLTGRVEIKDGEPRNPDDHLLRNAKGEDEEER